MSEPFQPPRPEYDIFLEQVRGIKQRVSFISMEGTFPRLYSRTRFHGWVGDEILFFNGYGTGPLHQVCARYGLFHGPVANVDVWYTNFIKVGNSGIWAAVKLAQHSNAPPVIMEPDGTLDMMRFGFLTEADAVDFGVSYGHL